MEKMDQLEAFTDTYSSDADAKQFSQLISLVKQVIKEDLAEYEIDWIVDSLFLKPVRIPSLILEKRHDDSWNHTIADTFQLLADLGSRRINHLQKYADDIVKLCLCPFAPFVRKRAVQCMTEMVAGGLECSVHVRGLINSLLNTAEPLSYRVPLAELIGTICEHRPDEVCDTYEDIWRGYLCVLEESKLTDSLMNGVIVGVIGLLMHFSGELSIAELNVFYDNLTATYMHRKACEKSSIVLLSRHAAVFPERVQGDSSTLPWLWTVLERGRDETVTSAILAMCHVCMAEDNKKILEDVYPKTHSQIPQIKNTAYKVVGNFMKKNHGRCSAELVQTFRKDVERISSKLQFCLQQKLDVVTGDNSAYDHDLAQYIEQASWLIENESPGAGTLLRLLILLYRQGAQGKRWRLVVHALLQCAPKLRSAAVTFLITECCQPVPERNSDKCGNIGKYLPLWRDLFDSQDGSDVVVLDNAKCVFDDFLNYLSFMLETYLEEGFAGGLKETTSKLDILLQLSAQVVQLENAKDWMKPHCLYVLGLTLECVVLYGLGEGGVAFVTELLDDEDLSIQDPDVLVLVRDFFRNVRMDRCGDEALLCVCCLALVRSPVHLVGDQSSVLAAYRLLFSRGDVEAGVLVEAVKRFERLLDAGWIGSATSQVVDILCSIERLRSRKRGPGKYGKILHRRITLFLGKYGPCVDTIKDDISLKAIRDNLFLNIPNSMDGRAIKINLQRILHLALLHEDSGALHVILLTLCANAETLRSQPDIEDVVTAVIHRLSRCWCRGEGSGRIEDLEHAVLLFDATACVRGLLMCITDETSPGVRSMLSDVLASMLAVDPLSDATQDAVRAMVEHAALMLDSDQSITKRAGLDITGTLMDVLKNNSTLTKQHVPDMLVLASRTNEMYFEKTFDLVTRYFFEKVALFSKKTLIDVADRLFANIVNVDFKESVFEALVTKTLSIIKSIYLHDSVVGSVQIFDLFASHFDSNVAGSKVGFARTVYVLSQISDVFDLDAGTRRRMVLFQDFFVCRHAFKWSQTFYDDTNSCHGGFLFKSVLNLLDRFADVLLEYKYQNTMEILSIVISTMPVYRVRSLYRTIDSCFKTYRRIWKDNQPHAITNSIHMWLKSLPITNITEQLSNGNITSENVKVINGIKLMLEIVKLKSSESIFSDNIYELIRTWPKMVMRLFERAFDSSDRYKMAATSAAMTVAFHFMRDDAIVNVIVEGQGLVVQNVTFCQRHISALFSSLMKVHILSHENLKPYAVSLLYEMVRYCGRKKCKSETYDGLMDMVDSKWSLICECGDPTPVQLIEAIVELGSRDHVKLNSKPGQWLLQRMGDESEDMMTKIKYMELLSGFLDGRDSGELLESAVKSYAAMLPCRMSELSSRGEPRSLVAILNALAASGNRVLLDIVMAIISGEENCDVWDRAIDECVSSLALRRDVDIALAIYACVERCHTSTTSLCRKMLVPLLRYSSENYNEDFFSRTIARLMGGLRRGVRSVQPGSIYDRKLIADTNAYLLIEVMFQKVSSASLESTRSDLNRDLKVEKTWYLPAEICKLVMRAQACVEGATVHTKHLYRQYRCASYSSVISALCKRSPDLKFFATLFSVDLWRQIVDCDKEYIIYIDPVGKSNKKRHQVSIAADGVTNASLTSVRTLTTRALFLRTLSDNPLQYDLLDDNTALNEVQTQELLLSDNELNSHECSATFSAMLCQLSTLSDVSRPSWILKMAAVLADDDTPLNIRWFLSQVIMNCRDELQRYANDLAPALLAVVSSNGSGNGYPHLNGLHVHILNTISFWSLSSGSELVMSALGDRDAISACVVSLVDTCFFHKDRKHVLKSVLGALETTVQMFTGLIVVDSGTFREKIQESNRQIQQTALQVILILLNNKATVPGVLPLALKYLEQFDKMHLTLKELAEIIGLAFATAQDGGTAKQDGGAAKQDGGAAKQDGGAAKQNGGVEEHLKTFNGLLNKVRQKDVVSYVRIVYFSHLKYSGCINEHNFRLITDLAPKMIPTNQEKCYTIIANYISNVRESSEYVAEILDSINISELLLDKNALSALYVAKCGFGFMADSLKRRVVCLVCDICGMATVKVRKMANELLLTAYKDTLPNDGFAEPPAKRASSDDVHSHIIKCFLNDDWHTKRLLGTLARALVDIDARVSGVVYEGVLQMLDKDNVAIRLCELVALVMVLPHQAASQSSGSSCGVNRMGVDEAARCMTVVAKLWLHEVRESAQYKKALLKDEPLAVTPLAEFSGPSKLLTHSSFYQGTFRTSAGPSRRGVLKQQHNTSPSTQIDVQVPVDKILLALLEFSEKTFESSSALLMEIFQAVSNMAAFDKCKETMSRILTMALSCEGLSVLTPAAVQMSRLSIVGCCGVEGFKEVVEALTLEPYVELLREEVFLCTSRSQDFMFSATVEDDEDMMEVADEFTLEGLETLFGKLSNWDDLTIRQRATLTKGGLPLFWTDDSTFKDALGQYTSSVGWVSKLRSVILGANSGDQHKWIRELDMWPRRAFNVSAIAEAITFVTRSTSQDDWRKLPCDIKPSDCLAEWSARLMFRSVLVGGLQAEGEGASRVCSRRDQLRWCEEANRRCLVAPVLQCIERNTVELLENETLPWLLQQIQVMRSSGLQMEDRVRLERALEKAEKYLVTFRGSSDSGTILSMEKMMLDLNMDLQVLTDDKVDILLSDMSDELGKAKQNGGDTQPLLTAVIAAHKMALTYYCQTDDGQGSGYQHSLRRASKCLNDIMRLEKPSQCEGALAMLLHRLSKTSDESMFAEAADYLFEQLENQPIEYDEILLAELRRIKKKLPLSVISKYPELDLKLSESAQGFCSQQLRRLRCPEYALEQRCLVLLQLLNSGGEGDKWREVIEGMLGSLLGDDNSAAAYLLLARYRPHLERIRDYEHTESYRRDAERTLSNIVKSIRAQDARTAMALGDLSVPLARYPAGVRERDSRCLHRSLHVPDGLSVVRFENQVNVFVNSVRRPVLVRALLSNGRKRGFLVKTGEDLRTDAACQYIQRHFNAAAPYECVTYRVTPIDSDCGVIEYLENHATVRSLIAKNYPQIKSIGSNRVKDDDIILQSMKAAVTHHRALCDKVPSYALRYCIIKECASPEEFILKKKVFLNSLSAMSVYHWILGLGDRHLENILLSSETGRVCAVDWAAILDRAVLADARELMPARLTRMLVAVDCDKQLLESRLQSILSKLRQCHVCLSAVIHVAFGWTPDFHTDEFQQKLTSATKKLNGSTTSYQETRRVLAMSDAKHKEKYMDVLDEVFASSEAKVGYSIEEQVRGLLLQCSDERILAVTRAGWEPWL